MIKKNYTVKNMHCTGCALLIEGDLEDAGAKAKCSYAKQTLEVEFDENRLSEEQIKSIVATSGYTLC